MRRRTFTISVVFSAMLLALGALGVHALADAQSSADIGNAGSDLRDGWYPDEPSLSPAVVSGGSFGQLWSAPVDGQVYAQPLLANGTLFVATENDVAYGLDPTTGAQQWSDTLATPWNPADIGCADIVPSIGTTSTPVIDPSTNTAYLTYKTYASGTSGPAAWYMDALDLSSGAQRPGFPVELSGTAQNDPSATFDPTNQQQRPGLLLMDGVVYAAFGGHCDYGSYQGWVFGVSTTGQVTARWVDNAPNASGAGIWQSGVGLMSDAPGSIFLVTGNGNSPTTPSPGDLVPSTFGESVVHLEVQPDGALQPIDYFTPFDGSLLDRWDADFGSGGVVGLPTAYFGTPALPDLAVAVGKQGYVYLLNLDSLGGFDQGVGGGDDVVQRLGPRGEVFGRPGAWPGDGGYVYVTTSSGQTDGGDLDVYQYGLSGTGQPSLSFVAASADSFGWGSGPPVITSDGTTSGSALVWVIWSANRSGVGAQLRAYDPVPVNGQPVLVYSAPIGVATNYSTPGVGAGRLYVGTRDGQVVAFGSPVTPPLSGSALSFSATTVGATNQLSLTLTANEGETIKDLASTSSQFTLGAPSQALPATLAAGQTLSVPVTFAPTSAGIVSGQIVATLGDGTTIPLSVSGTAQAAAAQLTVSQPLVSLGGTTVGSELSGSVTFSNTGGTPLTITDIDLPAEPFSATGLPSVGDSIAAGASFTVTLAFDPAAVGAFSSALEIDSSGGNQVAGISASAGTPGSLDLSSESVDFGAVPLGSSATRAFTIANTGGTAVTISKSKPPFGGAFSADTSLPEGLTIAPGASVVEQVTFTPTAAGAASGVWLINGDDSSGLHQVQFTGTGTGTGTGTVPSFTGASPAPTQTGLAEASLRPVRLSALKLIPDALTSTTIRRAYIGYVASGAAAIRFTLDRRVVGREIGGRCVAATASNRLRAGCFRYLPVATFLYVGHAGRNRLEIASHVDLAKLASGTYRLRAVAQDPPSAAIAVSSSFRLSPPARHRRHRGG